MTFSINNNAAASSILSNLSNVESQMNTSYQQLSTGNQVSSAADNPASYAISQQMTSQINGLNQATQNAQNGISMIQTATGSMNQIEQVLQTMSTLATEAASASNTFSDRANLQLEMNALAQQVNSTTNQTQYNGINLLTGQFGTGNNNLTLQVGANQGQTLAFNIGATDSQSLGVMGRQATGFINYEQGTGIITGNGITSGSLNTIASNESISSGSILQSDMNLNIVFSATITPGSGATTQASITSIAQSLMNSSVSVTGSAAYAANQINTDIKAALNGSGGSGASGLNAGSLANLTSAIQTYFSNPSSNAFSDFQSAVTNIVESTSTNGMVTGTNGTYDSGINAALSDVFGGTGGSSTAVETVGTAASGTVSTMIANTINTNSINQGLVPSGSTAIPTFYTSDASSSALSTYQSALNSSSTMSGTLQLETSNGTLIGQAVSINNLASGQQYTIGDTATGATMSLTINNLASLMTIGTNASGTYTQIDSLSTTGSTESTSGSDSNNYQSSTNVSGLNILTQGSAQSAITFIQNAINSLSSSQAQLGAVQNRLNYTVSNLQNSSQNLQNAQSTITNTNMASAYTQFSQQQVLEQVGISMLSQAQQQPQMILKLLQ